ncbi:MAG: metal-sulfur cluster assembly factor [Kiritimatiellaeota bacterium]|nr:metal-sulfur cluster assembly factor [Kiritimatiellota bacterium]
MADPNPNPGAELPQAFNFAGEPPAGGWTEDHVREALRWVMDPDLQINIVDLGLVYGIELGLGGVKVLLTLTSPGCPYGDLLVANARDVVKMLRGVRNVTVELVWEPPWNPMMMNEDLRVELGFDVADKGKVT